MAIIRKAKDLLPIALALVALSVAMYFAHWLIYRDLKYLTSYFFLHLSFLPIHALVLGLIIEQMVSHHAKQDLRRKLNLFLGVFFRQMGMEFLLQIVTMLANRQEFDALITVQENWDKRQFRRARQAVERFQPRMEATADDIIALMELLESREAEITSMTRNPLLLEFELLHPTLMSLFHLIEEMHFRQPLHRLTPEEVNHLARDAGKSLRHLAQLWLRYMEYLKATHPDLFQCRVGVCTMIQPFLLEDRVTD